MSIQAAAGSHSLLVPALPDLIWGTFAFAVIAFLVFKFAWPTFMATLDERREKIEDGLTAAARAKDEVALEREALKEEIADAHRRATEIREQAYAQAEAMLEEGHEKGLAEANRLIAQAQRQIEAEKAAAERTLKMDVGQLAVELASRIIGEKVNDDAVTQRIVERFLDDLELLDAEPAKAGTEEV